jgi:hypothetical protein
MAGKADVQFAGFAENGLTSQPHEFASMRLGDAELMRKIEFHTELNVSY